MNKQFALQLLFLSAITTGNCASSSNQSKPETATGERRVFQIDLSTALQLAGARNLDIQIAREKHKEAIANFEIALEQFFPWVLAGTTYRQHDNLIQDVQGNIITVHKHSDAPGFAPTAQVDLGDALYKSLKNHKLSRAAEFGLDAQREDTTLAAAQGYFDLVKAQAAVGVAQQSVAISEDYESQIHQAVEIGVAFQGDELRVGVQTDRNRLALRQAVEQQAFAGARLIETLHLDSTVELVARDTGLLALKVANAHAPFLGLVREALISRPELKQSQKLFEAARDERNGALYGPLLPSLGGQGFFGKLSGGIEDQPSKSGNQEDYTATIGWRIGPGGLFDVGRINAAQSRAKGAEFATGKVEDAVVRQVSESIARLQSLEDQIGIARQALDRSEEALRLSRERRQFDIANVLENIQAEQDLTRARGDYFTVISEFNKAQYALLKALGRLSAPMAVKAHSQRERGR